MAPVKREHSPSPVDRKPDLPRTASRALQHSIALLSSSTDLPPALYAQLLASLSDAVALTTAQEERETEQDRKRVKLEQAAPAAAPAPAPDLAPAPAADPPGAPEVAQPVEKTPMPSFWGLATLQGELEQLEVNILHDIEAGLPLLDRLSNADGKISLLEWEALLPVHDVKSNWRGAFFRPRVIFNDKYPARPPQVKLSSGFFHPNVYPSGSVAPFWPESQNVTDEWPAELVAASTALGLQGRVPAKDFDQLPSHLRLPLYLGACRAVLKTEQPEDPAQLEAYTLIKKEPAKYRQMVAVLADTLKPTSTDLAHLADAAARARWRTDNGLDLPLER
ncbi:hypothetical protein JCM9279_005283 [Rhodotorula babjevae]